MVGAGHRLQPSDQPTAKRARRKAHTRLDRVIAPAIGDVRIAVGVKRISAALKFAPRHSPIARLNCPGRYRAGIGSAREVIREQNAWGWRYGYGNRRDISV